jgi:hypothetical protein
MIGERSLELGYWFERFGKTGRRNRKAGLKE